MKRMYQWIKLKPISQILDIEPVLTNEMLKLAKWLKHETICYEIDALQVMLPSALRAKYEKIVIYKRCINITGDLQPIF